MEDSFDQRHAKILKDLSAIVSEYFIKIVSESDQWDKSNGIHKYRCERTLYGERCGTRIMITDEAYQRARINIIPLQAKTIINKLVPKVKP
jgi:hypothetical protein